MVSGYWLMPTVCDQRPQSIPKRGSLSCSDTYPFSSKHQGFKAWRRSRDHLSAHCAEEKTEAERKEQGSPKGEEKGGPSGPGGFLPGTACWKEGIEPHWWPVLREGSPTLDKSKRRHTRIWVWICIQQTMFSRGLMAEGWVSWPCNTRAEI